MIALSPLGTGAAERVPAVADAAAQAAGQEDRSKESAATVDAVADEAAADAQPPSGPAGGPIAAASADDEDAEDDGGDSGAGGQDDETDEEEDEPRFIRIVRGDKRVPRSLETSIAHYRGEHPDSGLLQVDLISAVHVADSEYYEELNRRFAEYDVVLYELVAPEGTRIPRGGGGGSSHPVGAIQQGLTDLLDLSYQLEEIDYTSERLKHADLSPEEFAASMAEKNESFLKMLFRMMGHSMMMQATDPSTPSDIELIGALLSKNRPLRLKRLMSQQMEDMDQMIAAFEGPGGSTLVGERNKRAIEVLKREVQAGKRRIAIFYGAAHMPDMADRLQAEFSVEPAGQTWLEAWNMDDPGR